MSTIADAAKTYAARGWKPVPVNRKTKKAIGKAWQKRAYDPAQFDANSQNVAVQFGDVSGGLVDVDLDTMEAVGLAPSFLPATDAIFGRRSKPCSHQLYMSDLHETETKAVIAYREYSGGQPGQTIVELRIGSDSKGAVTNFPPSMHPTGETVQWVCDGEPAKVGGDALKRAVLNLAVACLLKPRYPGGGSRHEAALVLGGVLARAGWPEDDIGHLVEVLARACGDDDVRDRVETAVGALRVKANGQDVPGFARLKEMWGNDAATTLGKWLGRRDAHAAGATGICLEDAVALDLAQQQADDLRYIAESSQWMRWAGERWRPEKTLAAFDESRKLCRLAGDSRAKIVAAVITLARSDRRLAATADQWDRDPMVLNAQRAAIDLATGAIRPAARLDYLTKQTSTWLAERGTAHPRWSGFLDLVTDGDAELIGFLQRFAGYCLTAQTNEHAFLFLYGPGANGKSVFVSTLAKIMGDYAIAAPMEMFLASKYDRHPTEIARLKGARLVIAQETQKGRRWDEAKIKALTSSDPLSGHFMRQDFFDFEPTHKLIITGNHRPGISGVNEAMRRRLLLVPFKIEIPAEERDPDFAGKLVAEHPAILRWMVDGCLEWQRDGLGIPGCVRAASDEYFASRTPLSNGPTTG